MRTLLTLLIFLVPSIASAVALGNQHCSHEGAAGSTPSLPTNDFVLNENDGTASHKRTGLTWQRCSAGQSWNKQASRCDGDVKRLTYSEALRVEQGLLNSDRTNRWRLPSREELLSIIETNPRCFTKPGEFRTNAFIFFGTPDVYWTNSVAPRKEKVTPENEWHYMVNFRSGFSFDMGPKIQNGVRFVRQSGK